MKTRVKLVVKVIFFMVVMTSTCVNAQMTIGSLEDPVKGALLDLKSNLPDENNVTSYKGGLLLSRVQLIDRATLQPFIKTEDTEWSTNKVKTQRDHIGLIVYNLTNNASFHPGLYIWKGSSWEPLASGNKVIVLPTFKPEWESSDTKTDLFQVYKNNFNPDATTSYVSSSGEKVKFPDYTGNPEDFYYVVTSYSDRLFYLDDITDRGWLTYKRKPETPDVMPANAFINVIMIKKN